METQTDAPAKKPPKAKLEEIAQIARQLTRELQIWDEQRKAGSAARIPEIRAHLEEKLDESGF